MHQTVENGEFSRDRTKVRMRFGDFIKSMETPRVLGFPLHSFPRLVKSEDLHTVPRPLWILMGFAFVTLIGMKSNPMIAEFSHWIFYLIPVVLVTWLSERWPWFMISPICVLTWAMGDISSEITHSNFITPYWNAIARWGSFLILTLTFSLLQSALKNEKEFSRRDSLTGVGNRRYFAELAEMEIQRSLRYRHPFTVIYIDLDDFKKINDRFGHSRGDHVLRAVAQTIQKKIRSMDKITRLGGDEFVVLLPETGFVDAALTFSKIRKVSAEISEKEGWPIAFSMGGVTFNSPPSKVDELLRIADRLMYDVKNSGKNGIRHEIYPMDQENFRIRRRDHQHLHDADRAKSDPLPSGPAGGNPAFRNERPIHDNRA